MNALYALALAPVSVLVAIWVQIRHDLEVRRARP